MPHVSQGHAITVLTRLLVDGRCAAVTYAALGRSLFQTAAWPCTFCSDRFSIIINVFFHCPVCRVLKGEKNGPSPLPVCLFQTGQADGPFSLSCHVLVRPGSVLMTANHITAMTSAGCAWGISFLGALHTVRAHGEYNYRSHIVHFPNYFPKFQKVLGLGCSQLDTRSTRQTHVSTHVSS